jgi:pyruvate formate lyase activating enzyme
MANLKIAGIFDSSTMDYPGKVAAVVYMCGCPYRCPWCQNPELTVEGEICRTVDVDYVVSALKEDFLIGAACVTGGEPLMQQSTLELLKEIKKQTELSLKLDTNGYYPDMLALALPYVDLLSMDIKAPLGAGYGLAAGLGEKYPAALERMKKSLSAIREWGGASEARTTIVPGITDTKEAIEEIASTVKEYSFKSYTLQQFRPMNTLDPGYLKKKSPTHALMLELGKTARRMLPQANIKIFTQLKGFENIGSEV